MVEGVMGQLLFYFSSPTVVSDLLEYPATSTAPRRGQPTISRTPVGRACRPASPDQPRPASRSSTTVSPRVRRRSRSRSTTSSVRFRAPPRATWTITDQPVPVVGASLRHRLHRRHGVGHRHVDERRAAIDRRRHGPVGLAVTPTGTGVVAFSVEHGCGRRRCDGSVRWRHASGAGACVRSPSTPRRSVDTSTFDLATSFCRRCRCRTRRWCDGAMGQLRFVLRVADVSVIDDSLECSAVHAMRSATRPVSIISRTRGGRRRRTGVVGPSHDVGVTIDGTRVRSGQRLGHRLGHRSADNIGGRHGCSW